ncbi:hypothetical protein [Nesterenkonia sp. Act20]|uniref:hypothetical protein n=1 Tax=Nesterenkonia sp. Act20 TaxID=1483432 RepID=UPI001C459965|nr:hypothetical protein [Nesterenkonia sp. Act20]
MVNAADAVPSLRPVTGGARIARGLLAAVFASGTAAISHSAAGHPPHWIVLLLALALSVPVCAVLSSVRLSRGRLGAAVLFSQAVLHGLFAIFPASGAAGGAVVVGTHTGHGAHGGVQAGAAIEVAQTGTVAGVLPDAPMMLAHVLAGIFTYGVLRRGELVLEGLTRLLSLRPIVLLLQPPALLAGPRRIRAHRSFTTTVLRDLWLGGGAQTLRGPPLLVN